MQDRFETVVITVEISPDKLETLQSKFHKVYYYPDGQVPDRVLLEADVWYVNYLGLPPRVTTITQIPRTKIVQLSSAGARIFLGTELMEPEEAKRQITVCSASGIHTLSIPQYIIANIVNLYMRLHLQFHVARTTTKWPDEDGIIRLAGEGGERFSRNRTIHGKTVGMLGYGHIARETSRLLKNFHCTILAANSQGDRRQEEGYIIPGTGDANGSIPIEFFSTSDPSSFKEFLSRCDILVSSLPSTPQTTYMLTEEHLCSMRPGAIFINVGRGDLVKSGDILAALNRPDGLSGAVLDVTDPEPLPDGHPLFTHPNAIITAHTSGVFENYYDGGADILIAQADRVHAGKEPLNVVDPVKGY